MHSSDDIYDPARSRTGGTAAVMGLRGLASTSHALATGAGLAILRAGGSAVDAAITISATLAVVEPAMSGPGGCGYLLLHDARSGRQHSLDFMGRLPRAAPKWSADAFMTGVSGALVPGAVAGWVAAHDRFGILPLARLFEEPTDLAERGVPLTARNADWAAGSRERLCGDTALAARYFPDGATPTAGAIIRDPDLARTYRSIAADRGVSFYQGAIANAMIESARAGGGTLSLEDLAAYEPSWQTPLSIGYRGWTVLTTPPPTSGAQLLTTLGLLGTFPAGAQGGQHEHLMLECAKAAISDRRDRLARAGAPDRVKPADRATLEALRRGIRSDAAAPSEGDRIGTASARSFTTAFVVADGLGNVVASTQSLGQLFGGARTLGPTGVIINDFAWWTDPNGPIAYRAGGHIESPLTPVLALGPSGEVVALATPGSNAIMQILPQVFVNLVDRGASPADAVRAPRLISLGRHPHTDPWGSERPATLVGAEDRVGNATLDALRSRGHVIEPLGPWSHAVGACALVVRRANGVLDGAADPRRDGAAAAW